ncbi:MAG: DUF11 domain-containing protein, partial [Pirellulaceae bacterium]|nr:DUF11 domain-containing protein [Pirellulaceae bacterium]
HVLRLSVLAVIVLVGWIAIGYAQQRGSDAPDYNADEPVGPALVADDARPDLGRPTTASRVNPYRPAESDNAPGRSPTNEAAASNPWSQAAPSFPAPPLEAAGAEVPGERSPAERPSGGLPADPFGLQPAVNQPPTSNSRPESAPTNDAIPDAAEVGLASPSHFEGESSSRPLAGQGDPNERISLGPANPDARERFEPSIPNNVPGNVADYEISDHSAGSRAVETSFGASGPSGDEGAGRPASDPSLDGPQTPQLSIQKVAPAEVQVGKPAVFRVEVKNTGTVPALAVEVRDQVPRGTRLVETKPAASRGAQGDLVWTLGKIEPGGGATVEMHVMPVVEGEIGSIATVHFGTSASTRTRATKPELVVNVSGPGRALIDEQMTLTITISNPGSGVANNVVLEEHVPPCLQHPAGAELEYEVGSLAPNESKTLELKLTAVRPGQAQNLLIARADAVAEVRRELPIEVVAPELKIAMSGPKSRYLEREATYELAVSNPGTAPARDVRLVAELPRGLKFVSANNNAHYDPETRIVQWALAELPTGETGTVQLTTLPVEIGQHKFQLRGTADRALTVKEEENISVDGIAAIRFEVVDVDDPVEVGAETNYEIRVLNQGSKDATRVSLAAELPPGLEFAAAEGPDTIRHQLQGNVVVFEPLPGLSPKQDVTYRIRVRGRQAGDHRIRVQLSAAELQSPVTKEESTRVFSDQ